MVRTFCSVLMWMICRVVEVELRMLRIVLLRIGRAICATFVVTERARRRVALVFGTMEAVKFADTTVTNYGRLDARYLYGLSNYEWRFRRFFVKFILFILL